jgi:hypothetical protein
MKLKDLNNKKSKIKRNPVAKNLNINKSATHKDHKKSLNVPRKNKKHKEKFEDLFEEQKIWTKDEIRENL